MTNQDRKSRVLIVDDDRPTADTLSVVFSFNGYLARAAYSAEEALSIAPGWRPTLAIVDVYLPKMNGIDLAVILKATYPTLQVVLFSGEPTASSLLLKAGRSFELLSKPVHPVEMLRTAARLLRTPAIDDPSDPLSRSVA